MARKLKFMNNNKASNKINDNSKIVEKTNATDEEAFNEIKKLTMAEKIDSFTSKKVFKIGAPVLALVIGAFIGSAIFAQAENKITIDNSKIEAKVDFMENLDSAKDSTIDILNAKIAALPKFDVKNGQSVDAEKYSLLEQTKTTIESRAADRAIVAKDIINQLVNVKGSTSDKDLEIIRRQIAQSFDDKESKSTYDLVQKSGPAKLLKNSNLKLISAIVSPLYADSDSNESTIVIAHLADQMKDYTAIYRFDFLKDSTSVVRAQFSSLSEGYALSSFSNKTKSTDVSDDQANVKDKS